MEGAHVAPVRGGNRSPWFLAMYPSVLGPDPPSILPTSRAEVKAVVISTDAGCSTGWTQGEEGDEDAKGATL